MSIIIINYLIDMTDTFGPVVTEIK